MTDERKLQVAALVYLTGLALHTADHFRRGLDATTLHVLWAGNVSTVLGGLGVVLILVRHRYAPAAAVAVGFPIAIGVSAVHFLPDWLGALSDSFPAQGIGWVSWLVVAIEVAGALAVGAYGLRLYRHTSLVAA